MTDSDYLLLLGSGTHERSMEGYEEMNNEDELIRCTLPGVALMILVYSV